MMFFCPKHTKTEMMLHPIGMSHYCPDCLIDKPASPTPNLEEATLRDSIVFIRHVPAHELAWGIFDSIDIDKAISYHATFEAAVSALPHPSTPTLRDDVLEEAAKECEAHAAGYGLDYEDEYSERSALACAEAIRALKSAQPPLTEVER